MFIIWMVASRGEIGSSLVGHPRKCMNSSQNIPDLGPLPKSDDNAELQRKSIKALNALLQDQDNLIFRGEPVEDYGVDGSFELKIGGRMTNFRAQVQLKATASVEPNQDGSISFPVRTANLNHLLNGTCPVYLLFDAGTKDFWYVWAHDESLRLQTINPAWKNQETVTLRFTERLALDTLSAVVDCVLREGRLIREIRDSLARSTTNEPVVISIDSASLAVTDPIQAQHILLASGLTIVAAGFPSEALRLLDLIDPRTKIVARFQLTAGYAHYILGNHYAALGHIRQALARAQELSQNERSFLDNLKDTCELRVGIIDYSTHRQRAEARAQASGGLVLLQERLEMAYYRSLRARDEGTRTALTKEVREVVSQILGDSDASEAVKVQARLTLLHVEGAGATSAVAHQLGLDWMRQHLATTYGTHLAADYRQVTARLADWEASANNALKAAYDLGHPFLTAQALSIWVAICISQLLNKRIDALYRNKVFQVPEAIASRARQSVATASAILERAGSVEGKLRISILHADFLEITGDLAAAKKLAAEIRPEAEAMGFTDIAGRASDILADRTLLKEFEREEERFKQTDEDIWFAQLSDEELRSLTRDTLQTLGIPMDRVGIAEQSSRNDREIARERVHWCRHLELLENLSQTLDPGKAFISLPNRKCVCQKFGYETRIETSEAQTLVGTFKKMFCTGCEARDPKLP